MGNTKNSKVTKMLLLALSAATIGNTHEAHAAGYRAGSAAYANGLTCAEIWDGQPALHPTSATDVWAAVVDGWYDTQAGA